MNNLEYYTIEEYEYDGDPDACPDLAWETAGNEQTCYMLLGRYMHAQFPNEYFDLRNVRQMKNDDGDIVTLHDVMLINPTTGEPTRCQGVVLYFEE